MGPFISGLQGEISDVYATVADIPCQLGSLIAQTAPLQVDAKEALNPYDDERGPRVLRLIENGGGGALVQGEVVAFKAGSAKFNVRKAPVGALASQCVGVVVYELAAGECGWVVCAGDALFLADPGTIDADEPIIPGTTTAGRAEQAGGAPDGAKVIGWAIAAAAGGDTARCRAQMLDR